MRKKLIKILQDLLDISDTELEIYSFILNNSRVTVKDIVNNLKISKKTAHEKLKKLISLGLIDKKIDKKGYIYEAKADKYTILSLLKKQLEKIYKEFEEEFSKL
ncbi:NEQ541 [Nanoarchaeum equitans Kin4-M]|uniref:NEQ541 n=1 Tax=Nanoarchaeum equitans (strain Kin4-M) TaxID=228908 RepID=Q74M55_NANEQ|nr:NEQ541 [Nanoarchaeum equitans Kin4-M]